MEESKTNSFLRQGSILAATGIIVKIIGMLYRIPLANIIGDEGNGIYSPAFELYALFLMLSSNAIPVAVSKMISEKIALKKYQEAKKIAKYSAYFAIITGGISALILFFGSNFFEKVFYSKFPGINIPLKILAPTLFIVALLGVFRGFFEGHKTMIPTSISQLVEQIVNAIISVYAAYMFIYYHSASDEVSAWGAAGGTLGTGVGAFAALLILLFIFSVFYPSFKKKVKHDKRTKVLSDKAAALFVVSTIFPIVLSQAVYQLSTTVDIILFNKCMEVKNISDLSVKLMIGVYSTDYRLLVNIPIAIGASICSSLMPTLVRAHVTGKDDVVVKYTNLAVKFNMIITIPCAFGMAVLSKPILSSIFPRTDVHMGSLMLIFGSICITHYAFSSLTTAVLQGIDKMHVPIINSSISLLIHIILVVILLLFTPLKIYALVIGNVTYPLTVCVMNAMSLRKYFSFKHEKYNSLLKPMICSIIMSIISLGIYYLFYKITGINILALGFAIIAAIVVYFALILKTKSISEEELVEFPMGRTIKRLAVKFHLY